MVSALQSPEALVAPVGGQSVLDEVVRADGEEGDLRCKFPGVNRRRGRLDHDPYLCGSTLLPLALKLLPALLEDPLRRPHLFYVGDHGEHDPEVARRGGPEEGPQLRFEEVRLVQAHPYPAPAKEGVVLLWLIHAG